MTEENRNALELRDEELLQANGGEKAIDQYAVKAGEIYIIYFPFVVGFSSNAYGKRSGNYYRIIVYKVFEDDSGCLFGTRRTILGIDMDNGEYVKVVINQDNVFKAD